MRWVSLLCLFSLWAGFATAQPLWVYTADQFSGRIYRSVPDEWNDYEEIHHGQIADARWLVTGGGKMYWCDVERNMILRANVDGSAMEDFIASPRPRSLSLDMDEGKLYWSDWTLESIQRCNLDGSGVETVVDIGDIAHEVDVDPVNDILYWTGYGSIQDEALIYRRAVGGGPVELIVQQPANGVFSGLAVEPAGGKIYFAEFSTLYSANLDGTGQATLATIGSYANDVDVDPVDGKLYWADVLENNIFRCDLDGQNVTPLFSYVDNAIGVAIDQDDRKLLWAEERAFRRSDLDGSNTEYLIRRSAFIAVAAYEELNRFYWSDFSNSTTYYGALDASDPQIFYDEFQVVDIHVDKSSGKIYFLPLDRFLHRANPDGSNDEALRYLPYDSFAIDIDAGAGKVYWVARIPGELWRGNMVDDSEDELLYGGLNSPCGVALDLEGDRVFLAENDRISEGSIDGGGNVSALFTGFGDSAGIEFEPAEGYLYWSQQGPNLVRRAQMQGGPGGGGVPGEAETILDLGVGSWPERIALVYDVMVAAPPSASADLLVRHQAAPNPFNPWTQLSFELARSAVVELRIFDLRGRLIRTLSSGRSFPAGHGMLEWNGTDDAGRAVASGSYRYEIRAGTDVASGSVALIK